MGASIGLESGAVDEMPLHAGRARLAVEDGAFTEELRTAAGSQVAGERSAPEDDDWLRRAVLYELRKLGPWTEESEGMWRADDHSSLTPPRTHLFGGTTFSAPIARPMRR